MVEEQKKEENLESMFQKLDALMRQLESNDISLEQSFELYNSGMEMIKQCNNTIDTIEKKVQILDQNGAIHDL